MTDEQKAATVEETPLKSVEVPSPLKAKSEPDKAEANPEPEKENAAGVMPDNPDEGAEGDDQEEDDRVELPRGVRKKLAKQSAKIARLAIEAETLRAQLQQRAQQPQEMAYDNEPTPEDYDFDLGKYKNALREHYAAQLKREMEVKRINDAHQKRVEAYLERDPEGWHEALTAPIRGTQAMYESIVESDVGPEIAVYLAKNLEEANRISSLPDSAAIRAIGRIEALIEAQGLPHKAAPLKKTTAAPPPPKTVTGASGVGKDINDPTLTTKQRIEIWKARRAKA